MPICISLCGHFVIYSTTPLPEKLARANRRKFVEQVFFKDYKMSSSYVKVKTVPRNQLPVHPTPPPIAQVAQTIINLSAHQQVLEAEISQIAIDIAYLEDANKRYARISNATPLPGSPASIDVSGISNVRLNSPKKNVVGTPGGGAAAIQKCFSGQIAKLKSLKIAKEATHKDVSQYLQLHQLHGASGERLLRRVEKELSTPQL